MKVICIRDIGYAHITIGKIYDVTNNNPNYYDLINDEGTEYNYRKNNFITLAEYREQQINEILE